MQKCAGERADLEEKYEKLSKSLFVPMLNAFILYCRMKSVRKKRDRIAMCLFVCVPQRCSR